MKTTREVTQGLVAELSPVSRPMASWRMALLWGLGAVLLNGLALAFLAPYRSTWTSDLTHWRFFVEAISELLVPIAAGGVAFYLSIPGQKLPSKVSRSLILLVIVILVSLGFGLIGMPALEHSTIGKRSNCVLEVMALGAISFIVAIILLRRLATVSPRKTAFYAAVSAWAPSGALMNLACMYSPEHVLIYHLLPVLIFAVLCGLVGRSLLRL